MAITKAQKVGLSRGRELKYPEEHIIPVSYTHLEAEKYAKAFKRVEIIDETKLLGKMEIEDLRDFTLEKVEEYQSVLVIVNTIKCAFEVFKKLAETCTEEYERCV